MTLEKNLTKRMLKRLRDEGAWAEKIHGGAMQSSGIPDIIGCFRGRFFALEVKVPGNKPTDIQEHVMSEMRRTGGALVSWVDSMEGFELFIKLLTTDTYAEVGNLSTHAI